MSLRQQEPIGFGAIGNAYESDLVQLRAEMEANIQKTLADGYVTKEQLKTAVDRLMAAYTQSSYGTELEANIQNTLADDYVTKQQLKTAVARLMAAYTRSSYVTERQNMIIQYNNLEYRSSQLVLDLSRLTVSRPTGMDDAKERGQYLLANFVCIIRATDGRGIIRGSRSFDETGHQISNDGKPWEPIETYSLVLRRQNNSLLGQSAYMCVTSKIRADNQIATRSMECRAVFLGRRPTNFDSEDDSSEEDKAEDKANARAIDWAMENAKMR